MKRMKPEAYKGEAHRIASTLIRELTMRYGTWNVGKIIGEIEHQLKGHRHEQRGFKTQERRLRESRRTRGTDTHRTGFLPKAPEVSG